MTTAPMPVDPARPASTRPRPVNGLGTAVAVLLGLTVLAILPMFLGSWSDYQLLSDHVSGRISEDAYWDQYTGRLWSSLMPMLLAMPLIAGAGISWLVWLYRARTNAGLLSPQYRFRYSPTFSVVGMVAPFANLWWSRPILEDVCRGSSPFAPADHLVRLVRAWWGIVIGGTVVSVVGQAFFPIRVLTYSPEGTLVDGAEEALSSFLGVAVLNTLLVANFAASIAVLAVIIRRVSRQQTELLFPTQ
jgi:hypothetical protein